MPEAPDPAGTALLPLGTFPRRVASVVGTAIALAVAFAYWHRPQPPPTSSVPPATTSVATAAPTRIVYLTVHVSGAVSHPGLVTVAEGGRVANALVAAGGVRPGGELGSINLAAFLTDGMHIVVPWIGDGLAAGPGDPSGSSPGFPVDVNSAGVERLTDLPGVGQVLATRILTYRDTHGPFETLEDLLDVPGIGEGRLAGLRDYAVVKR
ncbi:MAG: ComEA family DNA-binding protein [bacterium]|nr:ComEA family DNA-binding protein [bacterium]